MPYNGSGTFTLVAGNPVVTGTTISSTVHNNTMADIANNGLTNALTKDGQQTPTANLPMGGFRHTGVANGVARNDYAALGQVQDSPTQTLSAVAGTDTITASLTPNITAYSQGQTFRFVPAGNNTGSSVTININSVGAKNITKNGTLALAPGDLVGGMATEIYYDGTQFQLLTAPGSQNLTGSYSVRGLVGANNTGTPNTKFDLAADAVTLKGTGTRPTFTAFGTGLLTNDITVVGPAANGRDQVAAFNASTWIHFYFIWNGTAMATLSSTVAPATGPTLPTGYTHWAYAGTVFYNATPVLGQTRFRGSFASYPTIQTAVAGGAATTETPVSLASLVPPNALNIQVNVRAQYTDSSITANDLLIKVVSGATFNDLPIVAQVAGIGNNIPGVSFMIPNIGQNLYYQWNSTNGTVRSATVSVQGYTMPNGGEG